MKKWMYLLGSIAAGAIVPLIGMSVLEIFFGSTIVTWFLIFYGGVVWIGVFYLTRKSDSMVREALPPTTPVPEDLQPFHDELLSQGFQLIGEMRIKHFFKKQTQWVYFNDDHSIIAYAHNYTWARVWFSSYFEDGFDVTTYHEHGENFESNKAIRRVVKTSATAALDYHIHHSYQHIKKHGNIIKFANLEQHLKWVKEQQYGKDESKQLVKSMGRFIIASVASFIIANILWIIIGTIAVSFGVPEDTRISANLIVIIPVIIVCFGWAFRPTLWPETVESRKKRKPKELEPLETAQEEIYPF